MEDILEKAIANLRNEFVGEDNNTSELVNCVKEILPLDSTKYKILNVEGTSTKFKAIVTANLKSEPDVDLFVKNTATTRR